MSSRVKKLSALQDGNASRWRIGILSEQFETFHVSIARIERLREKFLRELGYMRSQAVVVEMYARANVPARPEKLILILPSASTRKEYLERSFICANMIAMCNSDAAELKIPMMTAVSQYNYKLYSNRHNTTIYDCIHYK